MLPHVHFYRCKERKIAPFDPCHSQRNAHQGFITPDESRVIFGPTSLKCFLLGVILNRIWEKYSWSNNMVSLTTVWYSPFCFLSLNICRTQNLAFRLFLRCLHRLLKIIRNNNFLLLNGAIYLFFWRANIFYFVLVGDQKFSSGGQQCQCASRSGVERFDRRTKRLKVETGL